MTTSRGARPVKTSKKRINLPKLPGYVVNAPGPVDAQIHPRPQNLTWKNGYPVIVQQPAAELAREEELPAPVFKSRPCAQGGRAPAGPAPTPAPASVPNWIKHSKEVLRFFGYFVEDVPDSAEEAWRVRRVAILHHLEDGTTQISEPRSERSVSPGFLVGRSRIPKPGSKKYEDGSFLALGPEDLGVGRSITANGREIHIVDADEFTRTHMLQRGAPQGAPLPVPENPIDSYRAQRLKPSGLTRSDPQSPTRFAEALLGRAPSTKRLQQFLEGNSRVLRYFAVWDDWTASTATDTVRRPFKIHYYLEDDTVEILEVRDGNVGREFYRFVARAPLPKGPGCTPLGGEVAKEACVGSEDLRIGATLKVHGRAFFIHDADDFTKQWCREHLGCTDAQLAPIDVALPQAVRPVPQLPPHTGFGDPEDTERNCKRLVPSAPKTRPVRRSPLAAECEVLRFVARLVDRPGRPPLSDLDRERTFTLSFFLADATLSMSEAPVPNSGIPGGKFLERGKVYKPRSPGSTKQERITEEDLWIGGVVELHGRAFELVSADERTRRALEAASLRAGHPCRK